MEVYYFDIEPLRNKEVFNSQLSNLTEERVERIEKAQSTADKLRLMGSGLLINFIKKKYFVDSDVETDKHGKPFFANSELKFNLSHSGRYVLAAVSDYEVGIDIQKKKADKHRIAEKNFLKGECEYINAGANDEERHQRFCEVWTLKEAYLKNIGMGLRKPLNSFEIMFRSEGPKIKNQTEYRYTQFMMNEKYIVSICRDINDEGFEISEVILEDE
ncbi:MAG: 4'-phosphopantetheinyl transferase superfamily protein [Eubacterium sp.]|nr:4'-phosphopantetheinyl transferase superfamily protein [Eubacterium sp.]